MVDDSGFFSWLIYKKSLKQSSIETVRRRLVYFNSWRGIRKLDHKLCEEFILCLRKKARRNQTLNGYVLLFIYLSEFTGVKLTQNISFFPKQPRVPTILSIDEIQAIIDAPCACEGKKQIPTARRIQLNELMRLSVWFLASTGCRFDEMASTIKESLVFGIDSGNVTFNDTKTGVGRRVPLPPLLIEALREYTRDSRPGNYVFTSCKKNKLIEQTFNPWLRNKVLNAGVNKHVHAHCFRNSYIMEHLRRGTDVLTIAKLVGHADINTTMGYTKFTYEDIEKGAENHPLFAKTIPPHKILAKISEAVNKWPVLTDKRFSFRTETRPNSLLFEIYVK